MPIKKYNISDLHVAYATKIHVGETEQTLNIRYRGHESNMTGDNYNIFSRH